MIQAKKDLGAESSKSDAEANASTPLKEPKPLIEPDETFKIFPVDPCIKYPSYMSLDDFVDIEHLKSLDGYLTEKLLQRIQIQKIDYQFYTGPYKLDDKSPDHPGSRMICLSVSTLPDSYFDLDKTELWQRGSDADDFQKLMDFIATLPFEATGRMLIMYDDVARPVSPHRDHVESELCHEFIWFRTNLKKPFYMLNQQTEEKQYVDSYTAWFDSVNQFHGSDASETLTFSIRVDGKFTDAFRKKIPTPPFNSSSTPSYWAALTNKKGI